MSESIIPVESVPFPKAEFPKKDFPKAEKEFRVYGENPRAEEFLQGRSWNLREFLNGFSCKSTFLPNDLGIVVTLERSGTVGEAFEKMVQNDIISIPIVDPVSRKPLYVLSLFHILDYLLHTFKQEDFSSNIWSKMQNIFRPKSNTFCGTSIIDLEKTISLGLDPSPCVSENCKLSDAVKTMLDSDSHRLLVTNSNGDLVNVISQSRIVELVSLLIGSIPKCSNPIEKLKIGTKQVVMVNERQTAYEAFSIMRDMKLSALPIVNAEGVFVGTISISDIKLLGWNSEFWELLGKPLGQYISSLNYKPENRIKSKAFALLTEKGWQALVRCREWHTFGHVIRTVAYFHVHRLFVVDATGAPTAVISLTDILKELTKD